MCHSVPSMDRNIKIVLELEQVFEPYRIMFKELTGKENETKKAAFITMFLQRKQNTHTHTHKILKQCFLGGGQLFACFHFSQRVLESNTHGKRRRSILEVHRNVMNGLKNGL